MGREAHDKLNQGQRAVNDRSAALPSHRRPLERARVGLSRTSRSDPPKLGWWHRFFDVAAGLTLLVATAPLLLVGVGAVLLRSGRPVFFGHKRLGQGGQPFRCWKLRTMDPDAQERLERDAALRLRYREGGYKLPTAADPRVTPAGRWLRRTHIDELPQLINVLSGDMSLVGPRPIVAEELAVYGDGAVDLLGVRPGIFGAWTCLGRRRPPYPERARIELEYARNRTWRRDLAILIRSIPAVIAGQRETDEAGRRGST